MAFRLVFKDICGGAVPSQLEMAEWRWTDWPVLSTDRQLTVNGYNYRLSVVIGDR